MTLEPVKFKSVDYNVTQHPESFIVVLCTVGVKKVDRSNLTCKFSNSKVMLKLH